MESSGHVEIQHCDLFCGTNLCLALTFWCGIPAMPLCLALYYILYDNEKGRCLTWQVRHAPTKRRNQGVYINTFCVFRYVDRPFEFFILHIVCPFVYLSQFYGHVLGATNRLCGLNRFECSNVHEAPTTPSHTSARSWGKPNHRNTVAANTKLGFTAVLTLPACTLDLRYPFCSTITQNTNAFRGTRPERR